MKYPLLLFFSTLAYAMVIAQGYEPEILVLTPNKTIVEKSLRKEIVRINESFKVLQDSAQINGYLSSSEFLNQSENIQQMVRAEIAFSKEMNFFKQISFIAEQYLSYRFFERFPNLLIILSMEKSDGAAASLMQLAKSKQSKYVLNFPLVELYKDESIPHARIEVQLFECSTGTSILNETYIGNWRNPGFEFACRDSTLDCTINNALSKALDDVLGVIANNSPTLRRERQLSHDRFNVLIEDYLTGETMKSFLNEAIPKSDSTIDLSDCYHTIVDSQQSKFVSFFITQVSPQNFKQLTEDKTDQNVHIISPKDIKEEGFLNEMPTTYAYLVKGAKYNNEWFYEKTHVTYFQSESLDQGKREYFNNLQQWNFFREGTAEFNPDFWETALFEKVRDLKKDPDWAKYGDSIWMTEEINNRDYLGLYKIVANVLRKRDDQLNKHFELHMNETFGSHYDKLKSGDQDRYFKISPHSIICPKDRKVALNPVLIVNKADVKTVHYFVAFSDATEVYEWTYFEPVQVPTNFYGPEVVDKIGSLTDWNFSVDNLNDQTFWDNYVLKKENGTYKYLVKIE